MASLIHGHAFGPVVDAVTEQMRKGTAYTLATETEIRYAQILSKREPTFEKIRFVNSGTEAVMATIKASRAFTMKSKIAKAEGAYHGTYDFAEVSQTANPSNWGDKDHPNSVPVVRGTSQSVLNDVIVFPYNDIERAIKILDKNRDDIACVLIDPVPHRIGLLPATNEFVKALHEWTRANNALLVFDEVVTFRVNYGGAQEDYTVKPDLTALGKIIGGGFPVGAIAGRSDVMMVFDPRLAIIPMPNSGTFSANPITMTAGRVAMEYFNRQAVNDINELTKVAIKQLEESIRLADVPVSITGAGSMFRFHLRPQAPTTYREAYQSKERLAVIKEMIDYMFFTENIMMLNTCACMLSTAITKREVDILSESMLRAFRYMKPAIDKLHEENY